MQRCLLIYKLAVCLAITSTFISPIYACELCAIYIAAESKRTVTNTVHFGVAEQFTSYKDIRDGGRKVDNPAGQRLYSSITQFWSKYDLSERISFQGTLPYIMRDYRRTDEQGLDEDLLTGIGDASLLFQVVPIKMKFSESTIQISLFAGLKLPSGDPDRLKEEVAEDHHSEEGSKETHLRQQYRLHSEHEHPDEEEEHTPISAIHGHDLALGSGSIDFPFGASLYARSGLVFAEAEAQYIQRNNGYYDYRFANDFHWSSGLGSFVMINRDYSLSLKINLSGEYKGEDRRNGQSFADTSIRSVFVGPELLMTIGDYFAAEASYEYPTEIDNGAVQITPSNRAKLALRYRF